jgi:hypothetical protein
MSNFLRRKWTAARSPSTILIWSLIIRLLSVWWCQGTSRRNGVSIIQGITRRNWWSGDWHRVGDFDCRVWALDRETEMSV